MKFSIVQKHLLESPVIIAVKDEESFQKALDSDYKIIFLLFGDVCIIKKLIMRAKNCQKLIFVHLDLIEGLAGRDICVDFIHEQTEADGIISTRPRLLKYAKKLNFLTVLRVFMLDSMALEHAYDNIDCCEPDLIEILPGIATKSFSLIKDYCDTPIIAGGLIRTKQDIVDALSEGAQAVSSSSFELSEVNQIMEDCRQNNSKYRNYHK